jgi:hypothetical protein
MTRRVIATKPPPRESAIRLVLMQSVPYYLSLNDDSSLKKNFKQVTANYFRPYEFSEDNQSNGSESISTQLSGQTTQRRSSKRTRTLPNRNHTDEEIQKSEVDLPTFSSSPPSSSTPIPPEEMSLVENVRSRKRMRRHSIAY